MSHSVDSKPLSLLEITELIIKARNIHEGYYVPKMELAFGAGIESFQDSDDNKDDMPTIKVGIKSIDIQKVETKNKDYCVDASIVNPKVKRSKKSKIED
ncbi:hypothetical protein [Acinetobacter haemolyticus]|uniref:hypothetical protein n=1 Tax=Acinetobacter haemolyticus TaxID=29430 RepID=UPI0009492A4F|nr:hypothetical protein [Acinetobacter haemolyticus]APR70723.1 hypothetical protein AHTJS_10295 [Acinetobacter haemolyticus]